MGKDSSKGSGGGREQYCELERTHLKPKYGGCQRVFIPFNDFVEIIDRIIYPKDHALTSTGCSL